MGADGCLEMNKGWSEAVQPDCMNAYKSTPTCDAVNTRYLTL